MESSESRTERPAGERAWLSDALAVSIVILLTVAIGLHRAVFDGWIGRHDILTAYLPWYAFLGQELRSFQIPGWNPHQFSGTPFAGDPQSGWMYFPVMLPFALFSPVAAFKITIALELLIAGIGAYAFARVVGLRPIASLMTAVVFELGPLLYWMTYCCTVRGQLAIWIPAALLGIELALRLVSRRGRIASWFLAGFAISQMFAGWLGQGALNGCLVVGSYLLYRALISPPRAGRSIRERLIDCLTTGFAMMGLAFVLGAAGLLPRLAINPATTLAGANYERIVVGYTIGPYDLKRLLRFLLMDDFGHRELSIAGTAIVLAVLAPFLARRRYAVPYFAGLTVVVFVLTLPSSPLHPLFSLIPRWRVLHNHNVPHVTAVVGIAPAMLAGAAIQELPSLGTKLRHLALVLTPMLLVVPVAIWVADRGAPFSWTTLFGVAVATLLIFLLMSGRPVETAPARHEGTGRLFSILLICSLLLQPTGLEIVDAATGSSMIAGWRETWDIPADQATGQATNAFTRDEGGAGGFLQDRPAGETPFRYFGYGGLAYPGDLARSRSYTNRRFDPDVLAILVNGRSIFLGLNDIQGYNPVQLSRYVDFITAANGEAQDYHHANIRPSGVASPLLDLLNVRYVVVDASLPSDRDDIVALTADRHEVFRNNLVIVYESNLVPSPAWIVHDVESVATKDEALSAISDPAFDSRRQAVVEGDLAEFSLPASGVVETAKVIRYEPDRIHVTTDSATDGLLVLSEIYAEGWVARIDGSKTPVLATDSVLRGVVLPAGQHEIAFSYEPRSLRIGVPVTIAGTIAMLISFGWAAVPRVRRLRRRLG